MVDPDFTRDDVDLFRQWFNAVQDCTPEYLEARDYELAGRIARMLNTRPPTLSAHGARLPGASVLKEGADRVLQTPSGYLIALPPIGTGVSQLIAIAAAVEDYFLRAAAVGVDPAQAREILDNEFAKASTQADVTPANAVATACRKLLDVANGI